MNIQIKLSGIKVEFTPDEWSTVKKLIEFGLEEIEEQNAAFLEEMKKHPELTPRQIENNLRNSLLH